MKARRSPAYIVARNLRKAALAVTVPHQGPRRKPVSRCNWCNKHKLVNEHGICAACMPLWTRYRDHAAKGDYALEAK